MKITLIIRNNMKEEEEEEADHYEYRRLNDFF